MSLDRNQFVEDYNQTELEECAKYVAPDENAEESSRRWGRNEAKDHDGNLPENGEKGSQTIKHKAFED